MSGNAKARKRLSILFTCVGRRIELLQAFRAAAKRLDIDLTIVATDRSPSAPGLNCVDIPVVAPSIEHPDYINAICDAIKQHSVKALIPTIDNDLVQLSRSRDRFLADGCFPVISDASVIDLCRDKIRMCEFLRQHKIDTPETYLAADVLGRKSHSFPYFIKPRFGMAGLGARKVSDRLDLEFYSQRIEDPIIQEFIDGQEYTVDTYVGLGGPVRCAVPRARWQVRAGEVIKGVVVKDREIMQATKHVVELLGPLVYGIVTTQCFVSKDKRMSFLEINPRFGGGVPLSIAAGADFPGWLMLELLGEKPQIAFDGFSHGLCMLRYDWSAFIQLDQDIKPLIRKPIRDWPRFE